MSSTTDFIAELLHTAYEVERLTPVERSRLLDRTIDTIREMRRDTGSRSRRYGRDAVIYLQTVSASTSSQSDQEIKTALLEAAEVIRTLKTVLDGEHD